jgi:hypothetical protein
MNTIFTVAGGGPNMYQRQRSYSHGSFSLLLSLVVFLIASGVACAQSVASATTETSARISERPSSPANTPETPSANVDDRLKALEEELRQQSKNLREMRAIIAEQQRVIDTLSARASAGELKSGEQKDVVSATTAAVQNQTPSLEERVKKIESRLPQLGPFRLSGDFRLRFDAILRKADPTPPAGFAPLTHQQNIRGRYRFRLNLDTDVDPKISFHAQLATGPLNNPLTMDQDLGETTTRHPFFISEAWIDFHPNKAIQLQGGRVQEIFADNSRFLFDDDIRFNGFNEKFIHPLKKNGVRVTSLELRAGQYILSNPNVAIVTAGSPLALAGAIVGSTGRSSNLFHQGFLVNQKYSEKWSSQFGADIQLYRNPNQIQLASTTIVNGVAIIVQNGLGIALSGPLTGTGNATTTPGGAIYTARNFSIARITYRLNWAGFERGGHAYPVAFNFQAARNVGIGLRERDAMLASFQVGRVTKRGDMAFLYVFSIKGANALISQVTDDDLGTNSGVNIRTNHFRFDYGVAKKITLQSLLFIQNELRNSGDFPNFFVPLNAFTPRQYRLQEQIVFSF